MIITLYNFVFGGWWLQFSDNVAFLYVKVIVVRAYCSNATVFSNHFQTSSDDVHFDFIILTHFTRVLFTRSSCEFRRFARM